MESVAERVGVAGIDLSGPAACPRLGSIDEQAKSARPGCCFGAVVRTELREDVRDVLLDGVKRDEQFLGNVVVRLADRQQPQDLDLPLAQRLDQAGYADPSTLRGCPAAPPPASNARMSRPR